MAKLNLKAKAVQINLSTGDTITIHAPRVEDFNAYLKAIPALTELAKAFKTATEDSALGIIAELPEWVLERICELLNILCEELEGVTLDEFKSIPLFDGLYILKTVNAFAPKGLLRDTDT